MTNLWKSWNIFVYFCCAFHCILNSVWRAECLILDFNTFCIFSELNIWRKCTKRYFLILTIFIWCWLLLKRAIVFLLDRTPKRQVGWLHTKAYFCNRRREGRKEGEIPKQYSRLFSQVTSLLKFFYTTHTWHTQEGEVQQKIMIWILIIASAHGSEKHTAKN